MTKPAAAGKPLAELVRIAQELADKDGAPCWVAWTRHGWDVQWQEPNKRVAQAYRIDPREDPGRMGWV